MGKPLADIQRDIDSTNREIIQIGVNIRTFLKSLEGKENTNSDKTKIADLIETRTNLEAKLKKLNLERALEIGVDQRIKQIQTELKSLQSMPIRRNNDARGMSGAREARLQEELRDLIKLKLRK